MALVVDVVSEIRWDKATTVNLAKAARRRGLRTLAVDLDPQAATTRELLGGVPDDRPTLAEVLSARSPVKVADAIRPSGWDKVDMLPSGGDALAAVGAELVAALGREYRLRRALEPVADRYDLVLLDCPMLPDVLTMNELSMLTAVGLVAAHRALIVMVPDIPLTGSATRLLEMIESVRRYNNPALTVTGLATWEVDSVPRPRSPVWVSSVGDDAIRQGGNGEQSRTAEAQARAYDAHLSRLLDGE